MEWSAGGSNPTATDLKPLAAHQSAPHPLGFLNGPLSSEDAGPFAFTTLLYRGTRVLSNGLRIFPYQLAHDGGLEPPDSPGAHASESKQAAVKK